MLTHKVRDLVARALARAATTSARGATACRKRRANRPGRQRGAVPDVVN